MGEVKNLSAIVSGNAVIAEPVTYNFSAIQTAINSGAANSQNYSAGGAYSQNIISYAILSQHLSASLNIPSIKIASKAVLHNNINFLDSGVLSVVRIGVSSNNMSANGLKIAVVTKTAEITTEYNTITVAWSNAVYGPASFTATPTPLGQPCAVCETGTNRFGFGKAKIASINSAGCTVHFVASSAANTESITMHIAVIGACSSA
jgi:hypothetical protein